MIVDALLASPLDPRGDEAARIVGLWWLMFGLGLFVVAVVAVALIVGVRRNTDTTSPLDRTDHDVGTSRRWIVGAGVIGPAVIIAVVFVATIWSMRAESTASEPALQIDVIGHQWWWEVSYPDHGVATANEVHIPAGVDVEIRLRSADVIHSFWVPALAGKRDALPERTNTLTISADDPGRFTGRCAEFCGIQHTNMDFIVVAHDAAGFDAWIAANQEPAASPGTALEQTGADLFGTAGCASCHTVSGVSEGGVAPAPDLTHLASRDAIAGGMLDTTTPDLTTWIADPHGTKPGVLMPSVTLSDDEIYAIVAYLESLT